MSNFYRSKAGRWTIIPEYRCCAFRCQLRWLLFVWTAVVVLLVVYMVATQNSFGRTLHGLPVHTRVSHGTVAVNSAVSGHLMRSVATSALVGPQTNPDVNSKYSGPLTKTYVNSAVTGRFKNETIVHATVIGPSKKTRASSNLIGAVFVTSTAVVWPTRKPFLWPSRIFLESSSSTLVGGAGRTRNMTNAAVPGSLGSGTLKRRVIVYSCNKITVCGGWADRQKGIVTGYVLSVLMDRDFRIDMPRPCDVTRFLKPNEVSWVLLPNETDGHTVRDVEGIDAHGYDLVDRMTDTRDLIVPEMDADYVFVTWNMELVHKLRKHPLARRVPWLAPQVSLSEIYRLVLHKLFFPTSALSVMLDDVETSRPQGTRLVCAQVRMGETAGFNDSESFNSLEGVQKLVGFLSKYNDSRQFRIFFASDSRQVQKLGKEKFPGVALELAGPITHVDKYKGSDACAGLGRAIADQVTLSTCDVLVISESGLGKIAAFLRNSDKELYLFHDSRIEKFRREMNFPNRVYW